ncbi:hypothetical protein HY449_01115 [Candidatus Pacearchaeota archaeon]|nr:hypothetical protein [Candidatus Pacearchaeota archaeon]
MEYSPRTDEGDFYKRIEEQRKKIDELNVSDNEKEKLYRLVDETICRFKRNEESYARSQRSIEELRINFCRMTESLNKIKESGEKIKSKIEIISKTFNPEILN